MTLSHFPINSLLWMSCSHWRRRFKETLRAPYDRPGASASLLLVGTCHGASPQWPLGTGGDDAAQGHQANPSRAPASGFAGRSLCRARGSLLPCTLIQPRRGPYLGEEKGCGWDVGFLGCPETEQAWDILCGNARYFNILVLLVFSLPSLRLLLGLLVPGSGHLHGWYPRTPTALCLRHGNHSAPSHHSLSHLLFG